MRLLTSLCCASAFLLITICGGDCVYAGGFEAGLRGYWKLAGDCKDYSGHENHGHSHGVDFASDNLCGTFDGTGSYIEVPHSESLSFGTDDFSITAWIRCDDQGTDVVGDIVSKYDPSTRRGVNLSVNASSPGYNSQGNNRLVCFGIDNAKLSDWKDCGRPSEGAGFVNNYVNSLVVFEDNLYAATTHAYKRQNWGHVLRYEGDDQWVDCGRVGDLNDEGVGPILVHDGELYAATWNYEHMGRRRRVHKTWDYCRVFRYKGGMEWEDCGQPGKNRRLMGLASYKGKIYAIGDDAVIGPARECYVYEGGLEWRVCRQFKSCPHSLAVHDDKLWVGCAGIPDLYSFDGEKWACLGNAAQTIAQSEPEGPVKPGSITQIHCMEVYRGQLCLGTWPEGMVAALGVDRKWHDLGCAADRPIDVRKSSGHTSEPDRSPASSQNTPERRNKSASINKPVEINSLVVYNGKCYAGTLPRIGLWRYESGRDWTLVNRLLPNQDPYRARLTSLAVYDGKLFVSAGCSNGNIFDEPCDVRGKVFCVEAGKCVSYDQDLGPGWKHIAAVKNGDTLELFVNGRLVAKSGWFDSEEYDLSTDQPLRIGFGELDYFSGRIREIRLYDRAITNREVTDLVSSTSPR